MQNLTLIKIGGKLLDDAPRLARALADFAKIKTPKILVHGGGKRGSELCRQLGIEPKMHQGRRITDAPTLEVVTMIYAGLLNKKLVAKLQALGCNAIGLSGMDGNVILAKKRRGGEVDFGFAGDVKKVNKQLIINFLQNGFTPIFSAITHDGQGQILNTNADTVATVLAGAMAGEFAVTLKYVFEKNGVLADPSDDASVLPKLNAETCATHRKSGVISDGMIPKLDNAFAAKRAGVARVVICGTEGIFAKTGTTIG